MTEIDKKSPCCTKSCQKFTEDISAAQNVDRSRKVTWLHRIADKLTEDLLNGKLTNINRSSSGRMESCRKLTEVLLAAQNIDGS